MTGTVNRGIDVIVVNYQTPLDLMEFLASFVQNPPIQDYMLHIVNVAPGRADHEVLRGWVTRDRVVTHVHSNNVGFARAVNDASREFTVAGNHVPLHDIIAIFNADVVLTPGALDLCAQALRESDWGALGPRQVDERNRFTSAGIFGTLSAPAHRGWQEVDKGQYVDVKPAVTVSGSAYFVKRAVWQELHQCPKYRAVAPSATGAFLPTPHYFEETYCSYHAQTHGYPVMYYGLVKIIHKWHRASSMGEYAEKCFPISQKIFREACDAHGIDHD